MDSSTELNSIKNKLKSQKLVKIIDEKKNPRYKYSITSPLRNLLSTQTVIQTNTKLSIDHIDWEILIVILFNFFNSLDVHVYVCNYLFFFVSFFRFLDLVKKKNTSEMTIYVVVGNLNIFRHRIRIWLVIGEIARKELMIVLCLKIHEKTKYWMKEIKFCNSFMILIDISFYEVFRLVHWEKEKKYEKLSFKFDSWRGLDITFLIVSTRLYQLILHWFEFHTPLIPYVEVVDTLVVTYILKTQKVFKKERKCVAGSSVSN